MTELCTITHMGYEIDGVYLGKTFEPPQLSVYADESREVWFVVDRRGVYVSGNYMVDAINNYWNDMIPKQKNFVRKWKER